VQEYSLQDCHRIFVARRRGKTAVVPVAFQGFGVTSGGKKTRQDIKFISAHLLREKQL